MFASRRSSLLFDKLPCLNIAFLTCCLFVIGHVSSMSLDRLGRQYQQQNDKQLEFSELILPEAESELLQNDMEFMPTLDGKSDMNFLIPASAASQEQNLQVLTEPNESQNSGNVESNSDMLMLESEDTPAMQILELPDELEAKFPEQLPPNSELHEESHLSAEDTMQTFNNNEQISDDTINFIAEATEEIKNEIETELGHSEEALKTGELVKAENANGEEELSLSNELPMEHKDIQAENVDDKVQDPENADPDQEMIGVVMEESTETPADTLEIESLQENEKIYEDLQAEESDMNIIHQSEEIANSITETNFNEHEEVEEQKADTEILSHETDQVNVEVDKYIKSDENFENTMVDEKQIIGTRNPVEMEMQVADEMQSMSQGVDEDPAEEESEAVEDTTKIVEEAPVNAEIKTLSDEETLNDKQDQTSKADQDKNIEVEKLHAEDIYADKNLTDAEGQLTVEQSNDEQSLEVGSLEESQYIAASQKEEEDIENLEEPANSVVADEKQHVNKIQSDGEIQSVEADHPPNFLSFNEPEKFGQSQLTSESQIVAEFDKTDMDIIPTEESKISESNDVDEIHVQATLEDQQSEKVQSNEEIHQVRTEDLEQDQKFKDKVLNIENIETINEETQSMNEAFDETQNFEELQPLKEPQFIEESLNLESTQPETAAEAQHVEQVQNLQTSEEAQDDQKTGDTLQAQPTELIQAIEESQPDELFETIEGSKPPDEESLSVEYAHSVEDGQGNQVENKQSGDNEQTADDEEIKADEISSLLLPLPEKQKFKTEEFPAGEQAAEPVDAMPVSISADKLLAEQYMKQDDKATSGQPQVEDIQNEKLQQETATIQKPFNEMDSDDITNNKTNESEPIKDTTSMLATTVQEPTKDELIQQEQQQIEHEQPAIVETASSTTLKPLNVLDSVLSYVNASFMNQMSNDNNNNKQEAMKEQHIFSSKLRRYDGAQVWRIVVQNEKERKLADELQTKFDGQLWKEVKQEVDYLLKPQVLAGAEHHVRAANLSRIVLIDNLQKVIEVENPPAEEIALLQNRKGSRLTWQAYHRLDDIHAYFDYLGKTYPDICSVETIGYSIEKRPLKILKISNGNANNPGIWIDGGMHAREWISPAVATYVANQIVEGWDDLPAYMRNINWYVHAVANPDGYEYSHTTDRLWRKNMRSHGRACPGVDLNRNFGYKWGGKGTSANPCSQTYRGSKAFSEPETFYISKFISNFPRETFKAYLSFHSYGQYILYPWGYDYHITTDMADLDLVARQAGTIITKSTGAKFTVGSSATTLYPAAGGSDDWAKGIAGIKYTYTIEMGDTGRYGFILPADNIVSNGKNGLTFVQTVAKSITMGKNGRRRKLKAYGTH